MDDDQNISPEGPDLPAADEVVQATDPAPEPAPTPLVGSDTLIAKVRNELGGVASYLGLEYHHVLEAFKNAL